jgi:catechol 2,3-dioxygenase-like lactoylglutathione lyase family enzyme
MTDQVDIVGMDHVQLAMPEGGEPRARAFYVGVLELREVSKPAELVSRGGCWFIGTGIALHLGVDPAFLPAARGHPALVVMDLAGARAALARAGVQVTEDAGGPRVARFYVHDPFGNRIELVDIRDAGFSLRQPPRPKG